MGKISLGEILGFTVTGTYRTRLGDVLRHGATSKAAFHTEIHRYSVNGETHYANASIIHPQLWRTWFRASAG